MKSAQREELAQLRTSLTFVEEAIQRGEGSPALRTERERLAKTIADNNRSQHSLHSSLESDAFQAGQKHDISSAAFYRQWTPRNAAQWITSIFSADWSNPSVPIHGGHPEKRASKMAEAITPYYTSLFRAKRTSEACRKAALHTLRTGRRVLAPTSQEIGSDVTGKEVIEILNSLSNGKSPGPDRLPNRLYKSMSAVFAPILTKVYNEAHLTGRLPDSMLEGLISLLYKKGPRDDPRNYRPITLLNVDYKILMRILTARMNKAVTQFVSDDQNGFLPNGFIAENTMRLQLIQQYIEEEDEEALFVFLDMEKAFDRCSWDFLIEGLEALNFDEKFVRFVKLAYNHQRPPQSADLRQRIPWASLSARLGSSPRLPPLTPAFPRHRGATHPPDK